MQVSRQKVSPHFYSAAIVVIYFLVSFILNGCQPSDTRGMCRDFEMCTSYDDGRPDECENLRIWFECDEEVEEQCEWRELSSERSASNDEAVPCEWCDHRQCPE